MTSTIPARYIAGVYNRLVTEVAGDPSRTRAW